MLPYKGMGVIFVKTEKDKELFLEVQKEINDFEFDYLPDNLVKVWGGNYHEAYVGKYVLTEEVWNVFVERGGVGIVVPLSSDYQGEAEMWRFNLDVVVSAMEQQRTKSAGLEQAKEMAYKFNTIVGSDVSYNTLLQKLERVQEEVEETFDAVADWVVNPERKGVDDYFIPALKQEIDKKELLDGIADAQYTLFGLMQIAEQLGYDVSGALEAVCKNNDSKFVKTNLEAHETAVMYEEQGIAVDIRYNEQYDVFAVVRKSDGKLMKPKGYKSVVLDQFLPEETV